MTEAQKEQKTAVEKQPSIDEIIEEVLGVTEVVERLAREAAQLLHIARALKEEMRTNRADLGDRVASFGIVADGDVTEEVDVFEDGKVVKKPRKFRSYRVAFERITDAYNEVMEEAKGHKKLSEVKEKIPEAAKKLRERDELAADTRARGQNGTGM